MSEHVVEIVSDSGEGAQRCGQTFGAIASQMGNGVWTEEIIPAEIRPPARSVAGGSGNRIRIGAGRITNAGNETDLPTVHWQRVMCPVDVAEHPDAQVNYFPIPAFVMTNGQRLANVWQVWRDGWADAEVRMTTWPHLQPSPRMRSVLSAPYLNQQRQWVNLLGRPLTP